MSNKKNDPAGVLSVATFEESLQEITKDDVLPYLFRAFGYTTEEDVILFAKIVGDATIKKEDVKLKEWGFQNGTISGATTKRDYTLVSDEMLLFVLSTVWEHQHQAADLTEDSDLVADKPEFVLRFEFHINDVKGGEDEDIDPDGENGGLWGYMNESGLFGEPPDQDGKMSIPYCLSKVMDYGLEGDIDDTSTKDVANIIDGKLKSLFPHFVAKSESDSDGSMDGGSGVEASDDKQKKQKVKYPDYTTMEWHRQLFDQITAFAETWGYSGYCTAEPQTDPLLAAIYLVWPSGSRGKRNFSDGFGHVLPKYTYAQYVASSSSSSTKVNIAAVMTAILLALNFFDSFDDTRVTTLSAREIMHLIFSKQNGVKLYFEALDKGFGQLKDHAEKAHPLLNYLIEGEQESVPVAELPGENDGLGPFALTVVDSGDLGAIVDHINEIGFLELITANWTALSSESTKSTKSTKSKGKEPVSQRRVSGASLNRGHASTDSAWPLTVADSKDRARTGVAKARNLETDPADSASNYRSRKLPRTNQFNPMPLEQAIPPPTPPPPPFFPFSVTDICA